MLSKNEKVELVSTKQSNFNMNVMTSDYFLNNINVPMGGCLEGNKLVLMTVTKDLINFIKVIKEDVKSNIAIDAVIDITLDYRPKIKAILDRVIHNLNLDIPIITNIHDIPEVVKGKTVVKFDHAIMTNELRKAIGLYTEFDHNKFNMDEFSKCIHDVYVEDCKAKKYGDNEFVFMIPPKYLKIFNSWLAYCCDCKHIIHAYGDDLLIRSNQGIVSRLNENNYKELLSYMTDLLLGNRLVYEPLLEVINDNNFDSVNMYEVRTHDVRSLKPIFVMSSDFGGGKFTYCRYKVSEDHKLGIPSNYLSPDLFVGMLDPSSYYGYGSMNPAKKGKGIPQMIYDALTNRVLTKGTSGNIYIKLEGSLENYIFPFMWNDFTNGPQSFSYMHQYFDDYEFHILYKGEGRENMDRFKKNITLFCTIHKIDPNKIKYIEVYNHCQGGYKEENLLIES